MAEYNTVPLGQSGTGSAFVLGQSQAANQFIDNQARNQQIAYQNALAQQKMLAEQNALWDKNALKVQGGMYWKPEFDKRSQEHIQKGIELRQQGINPFAIDYSDPKKAELANEYLLERRMIENDSANRKLAEAEIAKRFQAINQNPSKYDQSYVNELQALTQTPYEQAKNMSLPEVREAFDVSKDLVSKLDPVTLQTSKVIGNTKIEDNKVLEAPTKRNIETLINGDEKGKRWIKSVTGLTVDEAKKIPDSFVDIKNELVKNYEGNPKFREEIAKAYGITSMGQQLDAIFNQQAEGEFQKKQAYNGVINQYTDLARAKANEFVRTNPNFTIRDQQIQEENLQRARRAEGRAETRFNERSGSGTTASDTPQPSTKTFYTTPIPTKEEQDKGVKPESEKVFTAEKFVPLNLPSFGLTQLDKVYDFTTGKNTKFEGSPSVELTGMGYTPVTGGGKQLTAFFTDGKGNTYAMNERHIPLKTRNDKAYQAALKAVKGSTSTTQVKPATTNKKIIKGF